MRRLLTALTMFAVLLGLLGLGALAVLARAASGIVTPRANTAFRAPNAADPATSALSAPNAINKYNNIVLPLDIEADWASGGIAFTAKGLAQYIGASSVIQVLRWTPASQSYDMWFPAGNYGFVNGVYTTTPFSLATGGVYRLLINSTNPHGLYDSGRFIAEAGLGRCHTRRRRSGAARARVSGLSEQPPLFHF